MTPPPAVVNNIADEDLRQWRGALSTRLAGGTGGVRIDATGMVEVEVRWTERDNTAESGRLLAFTFRSQL
jgi:hypothetical protein